MEIANELTHKVLQYIAVVDRQGHALKDEELEAFASAPERRRGQQKTIADIALFQLNIFKTTGRETFVQYLSRLRWINVAPDKTVTLTPLAQAVLRELNSPKIDTTTDAAVEVVINPQDKFAYAKVLAQFADAHDAMIVDPYFRFEQLLDIYDLPAIKRVLLRSSATKETDRAMIAKGLASIDRDLEIRRTDSLHDRYLIPSSGPVWMLGTSLNGVTKNISVLTPIGEEAAREIRRLHEEKWSQATKIDPASNTIATLDIEESSAEPSTETPEPDQ